jgi:two-component system sensor histidine kinase KdpD
MLHAACKPSSGGRDARTLEAYAAPVLARLDDRFVPRLPTRRRAAWIAAVLVSALGLATVVVAGLEWGPTRLADASPVYFGAIVLVGSLLGPWPAIAAAVLSFVIDVLVFTDPRFTLVVDDPREWLDLVVFLVIAVVVGRLSSLGTERATEATRRAGEAGDLFAISRILATAPDVDEAAPQVVRRLVDAGALDRVWIVRDRGGAAGPRVVADSSPGDPVPSSSIVSSLVRTPGDAPAHWVRAHEPASPAAAAGSSGPAAPGAVPDAAPPARRSGHPLVRVRMEADGVTVGALKATLGPGRREPDRTTTRLLSLAADQLALAIRRDDLRREATEAEIARRADALKSALLDAVSHDLRTPLASIRTAAGSLTDPDIAVAPDAARSAALAIDAEAARLDRLVREVLDLSRIEGGSLRPNVEPLVLADAVTAVVDRLRPQLGERPIRIDVPDALPPVRADAVLLDGILANLVDNVARHTSAPAALAIAASAGDVGAEIVLTVDDGGPGLSDAARGRLFRKFESPVGQAASSRPGLGLGLAIVRGMAEAMGGSVAAAASPLGGLRVELTLPAAAPAPEEPPMRPRDEAAARRR